MSTTSATRATSVRDQRPWEYRSLIVTFARRDIRARFKGTLLGFAWSLALPLATLAVYSLVFGTIFGQPAPPMGDSGKPGPFPVWLFTGLVVWNIYAVTLATGIASLLGNGPLMKKIFFPPYVSVFGSQVATYYSSAFEVGLLLAILAVLGNVGPTWLGLVPWLALFTVFVGSVALMLSVANVYLRDVNYIVSIVLQLQFYLTPIIYAPSLVEEKAGVWAKRAVELQPLGAFVGGFRSLVYELSWGQPEVWGAMLFWAVFSALVAWRFYLRRGIDLSEEL